MHPASVSSDVRFAPKATKMLQRRERSDVPRTALCTAEKQSVFYRAIGVL
jgi:hypothetical protein